MPLLVATLEQDLAAMLADPKATKLEATLAWADVISRYAATVAPPSTALVPAKAAFIGAFGEPSPFSFITALSTFAAALALGMPPISLPPPGPLSLSGFLAKKERTPEQAARDLAVGIDAWFRTGTWTVPPAPPIPWI